MDDHLEAGERRVVAAQTAFEDIAEALLKEREPSAVALGLMAIALSDAILAGDREVLAVMSLSLDQLRRYASACEHPSPRSDGLLSGLQTVCGFAQFLLQHEYREAD